MNLELRTFEHELASGKTAGTSSRPRTLVRASWLNMVEIFFTSRAQLADKILDFICDYDDKARPFRWSYDGRPLKAA